MEWFSLFAFFCVDFKVAFASFREGEAVEPPAVISRGRYGKVDAIETTTSSHYHGHHHDESTQRQYVKRLLKPNSTGGDFAEELFRIIKSSYRKELIPAKPLVVKLDLLLVKVKNTIERDGIFETVIALFIEWKDNRLMWDPADFANISILTFTPSDVWTPDIAMLNSADHLYAITRDDSFVVRLSYDGKLKYIPTGVSRTWCHLKLVTFPFDIQTCSFEFESWSMDRSMQLFDTNSEAFIDHFTASPQWTLCQSHVSLYDYLYNFSSGESLTFSRIRFDFVVRRKSTFYIINLIFPCATVSLIQLLVFVIPSKETLPDRIGFGMVNMLTLVVFQTMITEEMPKSSDAITSLSDYIMILIITSAIGTFESVIVERLLRFATDGPPPRTLYKMMTTLVPELWVPNKPKNEPPPPKQPPQKTSLKEMKSNQPQPERRQKNGGEKLSRKNNSKKFVKSSTPLGAIQEGTPCELFTNGKDESVKKVVNKEQSPTKKSPKKWLALANCIRTEKRRFSLVELSGSKIVSLLRLRCQDGTTFSESHLQLLGDFTPSPRRSVFKNWSSQFEIVGKLEATPFIATKAKRRQNRYQRRWGKLVNRIDALLFLLYAPLSIALPMALFLPLLMVEDACPLRNLDN